MRTGPAKRMTAGALALSMVLVVVALVSGLGAAETDVATIVVTVPADADPVVNEGGEYIHNASYDAGTRASWQLTLPDDYTIFEIRVEGAFDVERPQQLVPLLDGEHFVKVGFDVAEVDQPARVATVNGTADAFTMRLGLPGPGPRNLTLHVDDAPPAFVIGEPKDVTHISFLLETRTDEAALATLWIAPADGSRAPVEHPTPNPAGLQRFPVQGLRADTTYHVWITFEDWSGNEATSPRFTVTTRPEPVVPVPTILSVEPPSGSALPPGPAAIRVSFESPLSPVRADDVRLFFDKREVVNGLVIEFLADNATSASAGLRGTVTYVIDAPLDPRRYSASVEVENEAGGLAVERWNFVVEAPADTPLTGMWSVGALALAALGAALAGRRGPQRP